jgi:hypothetical protein
MTRRDESSDIASSPSLPTSGGPQDSPADADADAVSFAAIRAVFGIAIVSAIRGSAVRRASIVLLLGSLATAAIASHYAPVPGGPPPPRAPEPARRGADPSRGEVVGIVTETIDVSYYTYVEIDTGRGRIWVAGPRTAVEAGDTVSVSSATRMTDFVSRFLDRTFDVLYLVPSIEVLTRGKAGAPEPDDP